MNTKQSPPRSRLSLACGSASKLRFRESRTAMLIDLMLTPIIIPCAMVMHGVPEVLGECKRIPGDFARNWKGRHWL